MTGPRTVVETIRGKRGDLCISRWSPRIFSASVHGVFGVDLLDAYLQAMEGVTRAGAAITFNDLGAMDNYDAVCREQITRSLVDNRDRYEAVHVLVGHRVVAMAVAIGSMMVGRGIISSYTDRAVFDAKLKQALERELASAAG